MFNTAQVVLDKTESLLVSKNYNNRFVKWISKCIGGPFSFLLLGWDELIRPMKSSIVIFFILSIILVLTVKNLDIQLEMQRAWFSIICIVTFMITAFSLPSTFSFSGVSAQNVNEVADLIEAEKIETVQDVELLEQNFEIVFKHVYSRVKFYQLLIATSWGLYLYYFNFGVLLFFKKGIQEGGNELGNHMGLLVLTALITLVALLFVSAYKRANERLTKTIQFACIQVKYDLAE